MRRRLIGIGVLLLLAWGCSDTGSFWVTIRFPDPQSKDVAQDLSVYAIEPAEDSGCPALMDGTARPNDSGYAIEDRVDISMPATEGSRPLEGIGPGQRLFFVEATDQQDLVFLRGCTSAMAGGKGVQTVIVVLEKLPECQTDADCVDSDSCLEGACTDGTCSTDPSPDGTACDDGLYCTVGETCLSGACQGSQPRDCSASCVDGNCNENQARCVGTNLDAGTPCDDDLYCTENDACDGQGNCLGDPVDCSHLDDDCNQGVCDDQADACAAQPANEGSSCEDGLYCTVNDICQSGTCIVGQLRDCSAFADQCLDGVCREGQDRCQAADKPAGTACDDGIGCTSPDECDGAGICVGVPNDTLCPAGEYCRPACTSDTTGCMQPPILQVDCPDSVPVDQPVACTVRVEGLLNQESCLTCVPHLLHLNMPLVDFSLDSQPDCNLQGWQLESGDLCQDPGALPICPLNSTKGAGPSPCCTNLVCPTETWPAPPLEALEADRSSCADKEWRLYQLFDFRGYDQGKVCYDFGGVNTGAADIIQLQADPSDESQRIVIRCREGAALPSAAMMVDCRDLPVEVFGWAQTRLTFWMRSDVTGHAWGLDNLWVTAQYQNCQPTTVVAFEEDFEGCPATIPDGWNNWSVQGTPRCLNTSCASDGLEAQSPESWVIEHDVDTSDLTEAVHLCWTLGDENWSAAQFIVEFNTGTVWQEAYRDDDALVYGAACVKICRELTAIDPAAAANPSLKIRFDMTALNNAVMLDDITVSGPERCDATGLLQAGTVTPSASNYTVNVGNPGDIPYQVQLECDWGLLDPPVTASDSFRFTLP